MQLGKLFACVLLLLSVVYCNEYWTENNSIEYTTLPTVVLGNFEGSYTSNTHLGFGLNICQDGDQIYGSYDELGIFNGEVDSDNVVKGDWYQAGTSSCSRGSFQIQLTSEGFDGFYTCGSGSSKIAWTETKLSPYRPSDVECAKIDLNSTDSIAGRYTDVHNQPKDLCNSKADATGSYLYLGSDDVVQKGYFEGTAFESGKIFTGTWYSPVPLAGAALYYLNVDGNVYAFFWTGLDGTEGDTIINPAEYHQSQYHRVEKYSGPISKSSSDACDDYETIKTKVLNNLVADNDDDLYYFVTSDFNFVVDDDGYDDDGLIDDDNYSSDASHVYWSILPLLLALFF